MSTDAAADVLSDLVQTTTRSTHLHSFCYVPFSVNSLESDLLGLRRVLSVWSKDLANRAGDTKAAKAKSYPVLSSPKHNHFSKMAPKSYMRVTLYDLWQPTFSKNLIVQLFFCGCKITTFPINAIPPIQLTTFNDDTYSLRSTSLKYASILKNVKCKAFRYF